MDYKSLSDKELVSMAKQNNANAIETLLEKYKYISVAQARSFFLLDGDENDLIQEGMIAIFKGIMSFDETKSNLNTYLTSCVKNRLIDTIKKSDSNNNSFINYSFSLSSCLDTDEDKNIFIQDKKFGPEELLVNQEAEEELKAIIEKELTVIELKVLEFFKDGYSYSYIAEKLNKSIKSIDNTIQRIKKKLKKILKK